MRIGDKILDHVRESREPLCVFCLADGLGLRVLQVQNAMPLIEGRRVRRHYQRCSRCGVKRLVATLVADAET